MVHKKTALLVSAVIRRGLWLASVTGFVHVLLHAGRLENAAYGALSHLCAICAHVGILRACDVLHALMSASVKLF